jgi:hypothetical protein
MRNIEDDIRELLDDEARSAPAPHQTAAVVGRTQRRQGAVIAGGALAAIALVAVGIVGLRAVGTADRGIPANQPTVTTTLNGISMSHPEGWYVVDPDEAGLNGPDPRPDLPRLVFAVAPFDPGELFGCPGMVEGTPHAFLMTIQEEARVLSGAASAPWPVALEPLGVDASEAACYPEWEFLRAGWTTAGRTFEARVGFAPDVSDGDREALFAAFASMTFEPDAEAATSMVLATGTAGGEEWELIANRQTDGLSLMLQGHSFGTGTGGFDPSPDELQVTSHVFGDYGEREVVVFGAVPAGITNVEAFPPDDAPAVSTDVLDVPDEIDTQFNAFVLVAPDDLPIELNAYDADGNVVLRGTTGGYHVPRPTPSPDEVIFRGRTNDCLWTLSRASVAPARERIDLTAEDVQVGFLAKVGPDAPPLQLASFTCPRDPGGTLVFGLYTEEVADLRWPTSAPDEHGVPDCVPTELSARFCLFLLDGVGDMGEVVALDVDGNEISRASFS